MAFHGVYAPKLQGRNAPLMAFFVLFGMTPGNVYHVNHLVICQHVTHLRVRVIFQECR